MPAHADFGMSPMMVNQGYPNSVRNFPVNEVIWESFEIRPMKALFHHMKTSRFGPGDGYRLAQLRLKFTSQFLRNRLVAPHSEPVPRYEQRLTAVLEDLRSFYRDEMQRQGFGPKTFELERDANGKLVIHLVKGKQPDSGYARATWGARTAAMARRS
jgi:hypothetical protein